RIAGSTTALRLRNKDREVAASLSRAAACAPPRRSDQKLSKLLASRPTEGAAAQDEWASPPSLARAQSDAPAEVAVETATRASSTEPRKIRQRFMGLIPLLE